MNTVASPVALARFQDAFSRALLAPDAAPDEAIAGLVVQPAFAVYRNTVMKGCIDALQANFPSVARLVGEEWFRAAASVHAATALPTEASLLRYGDTFPGFLAGFAPAAELPYLADVARLDRFWTEAHAAADEEVLDLAAIAAVGPDQLADATLHPHAAARWAWFADAPIYTIWRRNREQSDDASEFEWRGEGALLTRPGDAVRWTALSAAGCRFLDACAKGEPVATALDAALETDAGLNPLPLLSALLETGAFGRLTVPPHELPERISR
ncbi:MAG: putative DNA-binding domain-containing protein [Betaproteobacteria bacterium]|nr:putative DNA-binding domain-containing protein [Betaproteobacteria bacterium]